MNTHTLIAEGPPLGIFGPVLVLVVLAGLVFFLYSGGSKAFLKKTLYRNYDGISVHKTRQAGDVEFVYHTYRGLVFWFIQEEHRVFACSDDAKELLGRLLRFNLTYGMMSYGMIFIPFLAIGNYFTQKRRIG